MYQLNITFDKHIEDLIYSEGVYPTQGTRPVFTTIYQIINTRLGKVLYEIFLNGYKPDTLEFTINDKLTPDPEGEQNSCSVELVVNFIKKGHIIHSITEHHQLVLGKLRQAQQNDMQAIVAVHESGHSVVSIILQKVVPDSIVSVTAGHNESGFTSIHNKTSWMSRQDIKDDIAMSFGGILAEKLVFGENKVTQGAVSDLQRATHSAYRAIYDWGMGGELASFGNPFYDNKPVVYDTNCAGVNKKIKDLLEEAKQTAEAILEKQKPLLLHLADYLSDNRCILKDDIKEYIAKYAVDFTLDELIEDANLIYYRNKLKEQVA
jgi:cell division protease FtsH